MRKKTLTCPEEGCPYTARRPLAMGGVYAALCPHGHGTLVELVVEPRNKKPKVNTRTGKRRRH